MPDRPFISDDVKEAIRTLFKKLKDRVLVEVYTKMGVNDTFNDVTSELFETMSTLSDKLDVKFHTVGDELSRKRDISRSPVILIAPDKYHIRYTGAPLGEEGRSLTMSLIMASSGRTLLTDVSKKRLDSLKEKRYIKVFVSPTCPYCPQQVLYAVSAAIEKKDLVSVEIIEIYENRDIAEKYGAMSVPRTFADDVLIAPQLQTEEAFIESLVKGEKVEYVAPSYDEDKREYDVVVIGGGPAGLTAAMYAKRSGLDSVVFERANIGGQIAVTPVVENYPGFSNIPGRTLVELMANQTMTYSMVFQGAEVNDAERMDKFFELDTTRGHYRAKALIIAAGVKNRKLDAAGEEKFVGRGVSYCATCDGYMFKDGRNVIVIGGGNSALTDALYLDSLGAHVTIVHRKDSFRGEARLQQSVFQRNIPVLWNKIVKEIKGKMTVEEVKIEDVKTKEITSVKTEGIFVAVGYEPNNEIAKKLGLELDSAGYIKVDNRMRTSVPFVYAAGDITGGVKQIVTAVSQAAVAALTAFEDIASPYWKKDI